MSRFRAGQDALAATLPDGAVLLNLRTNRYHSLNETGTRVWQLLIEGKSEDEIVETMTSEYHVAEPVAREETRAVIMALKAQELIVETTDQ